MTNDDARVTLREVTEDTLSAILKLEVSAEQKNFVAPNAVSIAQAHFSKHAWFRAIYVGETPVGFVMLYLNQEKPEYWVWRFMIDVRYQLHGYGQLAMGQVIEYVRGLPGAKELFLSYAPGEGEAAPFYRKCGFVETGDWEHDEKVMRLVL